MSRNRDQLLEQLEGLGTSLTAVLDRLGQIELEIAASKSEANRQISAIRDFLNSPEIAALAGPDPTAGADVSRANEAIQKLSVGETQEQILEIFLEEVDGFTDRAILFLQRGDSYTPWKSLGFDSSSLDLLELSSEDPIHRAARQQRIIYRTDDLAEAFPWLSRVGPVPATAVCIPLIFEDTAPVVLFADASQGIELDSLELLTHLAVLVLKNHYLMARLQGTAGDSAGTVAAAAGVSDLDEPPSPMPFPEEAPEEAEEEQEEAQEEALEESAEEASLESIDELIPPGIAFEDSVEELAGADLVSEADSEVEDLSADLETETDDEQMLKAGSWTAIFEPVEEEAITAEETVEEDIIATPLSEEFDEIPSLEDLLRSDDADVESIPDRDVEDVSIEEEVEEISIPDEDADDVLTFEGTAREEEVEEIPAEQPLSDPAVEVTPPPPLPVAAEPEPVLDPETERKHQEAHRFARLLVSEIKLYHEESVVQGRKNSDLYSRLMRDIDRSREMYERRADPVVKKTHDHYHAELIRILAEGNEAHMGSGYPGPHLSETS